MQTPFKTIDLRHNSQDAKYHSRLIWQVLFDEYKALGCDLTSLDSLLCDLYHFERCITTKNEFFVCWYCDGKFTDTTTNHHYIDYMSGVKVNYTPQEITFTRLTKK